MKTYLMSRDQKKITQTSGLDIDFIPSTGKAVLKLNVDGMAIAVELGEDDLSRLETHAWSCSQEMHDFEIAQIDSEITEILERQV